MSTHRARPSRLARHLRTAAAALVAIVGALIVGTAVIAVAALSLIALAFGI